MLFGIFGARIRLLDILHIEAGCATSTPRLDPRPADAPADPLEHGVEIRDVTAIDPDASRPGGARSVPMLPAGSPSHPPAERQSRRRRGPSRRRSRQKSGE